MISKIKTFLFIYQINLAGMLKNAGDCCNCYSSFLQKTNLLFVLVCLLWMLKPASFVQTKTIIV